MFLFNVKMRRQFSSGRAFEQHTSSVPRTPVRRRAHRLRSEQSRDIAGNVRQGVGLTRASSAAASRVQSRTHQPREMPPDISRRGVLDRQAPEVQVFEGVTNRLAASTLLESVAIWSRSKRTRATQAPR